VLQTENRLVTGPRHPRNEPGPASGGAITAKLEFPKTARILRSAEFRAVYDQGFRVSSPLFAAFCLAHAGRDSGPRLGVTATRAIGGAVVRNKIKRRLREAFRLHRADLEARWDIVVNPRRAATEASFEEVERALLKVIARCESGRAEPSQGQPRRTEQRP
jgi:ribonuclease P protein component